MKKINFLFGIHCHQPVGNFEHVFEQAYDDCYLPFMETMERHPKIKFSIHYSGILYDWFEKNRPEYLDLVASMVRRGQLEIMSAGHYEPIIPVIPDEDKIGQIAMQSEYIKKRFKTSPTGIWLTERIWEPNLPSVLARAGIEYLTVDDYHFISAGIEKEKLFGHYVTEDQGVTLKVFPINKQLRYLVPFRLPQETIKYLYEIATEEGNKAAILADDGEKFGVWPGTKKWVYEDGYLENLLSEIEKNIEWIRPMKFSEYLEEFPAQGRVYLPTASYFEMMEWALPARSGAKLEEIMEEIRKHGKDSEYAQFFKGGFFRNFFVKYPESNNMHKKMLFVSQKISTLKKGKNSEEREKLIGEAQKNLYKGECNCAYWHGVFGGLYLMNLRHAVYEHLIRAENIVQLLQRGDKKYTELIIQDFDRDGREDVMIANPYLNLYFSPAEGGGLFELDYKPKEFNLLNVLTRREEAYHKKLLLNKEKLNSPEHGTQSIHDSVTAKEAGLDKLLVYDRTRRMSLVDRFYEKGTDNEFGSFAGEPYDFIPVKKNDETHLTLSRISDGIKVSKTVSVLSGQSIIGIEYEVANLDDEPLDASFGVEFNLTLLASDASDRYYRVEGEKPADPRMRSSGKLEGVSSVQVVDEWKGFGVSFELSGPAEFIRYPIETVSQSEGGFERTYQGSCLQFRWDLGLGRGECFKNKIMVRIEGV